MANFDLAAAAHDEMVRQGFHPDFPPETAQQIAEVRAGETQRNAPQPGVADLRAQLWSSIDNDTSRDLDQVEVAERQGDIIIVRVGIADVDAAMPKGSPLDQHAADATTSVYTPAKVFPMLPEEMSTDLTSLNENEDRISVVIEYGVRVNPPENVCEFGDFVVEPKVYRALLRNKAQLAYDGVGNWLEGHAAAPPKVASSQELQDQLKMQDEAAQVLRRHRILCGALDFDRVEAAAQTNAQDQVTAITARKRTRANMLIEDFMIAANEVMARTLEKAGRSSIRRVVRTPKRWDRIVQLAKEHGYDLPAQPDSGALNDFLEKRKQEDPVHYPDVSLTVIKLMGPGIYVRTIPGAKDQGHFGLAASDYAHSTAPNRRFADDITQRCMKALIANAPPPYTDGELDTLATHCTEMEDAARKVERNTLKMAAALTLQHSIGKTFQGVVTGAGDKGTYVRIVNPPVEGRVVQGGKGLDVGDRVTVKLLHANPQRGWIDFAAN